MPDTEEVADGRGLRLLLVLVLSATVVGGAVDLALDSPDSLLSAHALFEMALILLAMATFILLWRGWWGTRRSLAHTQQMLDAHRAERDAWRASAESALAGLGAAIERKFEAWGLTPAEREIALLLLKGRSHKEIAYGTGRGERTVRQHAVDIYQKSGLRGRAELAAFFLEGISLPSDVPSPPGAAR